MLKSETLNYGTFKLYINDLLDKIANKMRYNIHLMKVKRELQT